ncbi:MAG: hypothetical protein JXQ75_20180 [Phycisphaerae bacterium]|nr:hypothetical protein [Phycisphaerae bacterium]
MLILILWAGTQYRVIGRVGGDGYSFFVGNGAVEYGYGWGWIRRRMFPVGIPPVGWSIRPLMPAPSEQWRGLPGGPNGLGLHVPFWALLLIPLLVWVSVWQAESLWSPPPHRRLKALMVCGGVAIALALLLAGGIVCHEDRQEVRYLAMGVLCLLTAAIPQVIAWLRDRRRCAPGLCERCGYDLTGNVSGRCPECGTAVRPTDMTP